MENGEKISGRGEKIRGSVVNLEQNKHRNSQVNSTYMIKKIIIIIIRQQTECFSPHHIGYPCCFLGLGVVGGFRVVPAGHSSHLA